MPFRLCTNLCKKKKNQETKNVHICFISTLIKAINCLDTNELEKHLKLKKSSSQDQDF